MLHWQVFFGVLATSAVVRASFNFIAIGDWGADPFRTANSAYDDEDENDPDAVPYGTDDQRLVADRMDQWAGENGLDIIVSGADNFYPDGLESMDDPRFDLSWRYMYNGTNLNDKDWYISLGNHDHFLENAMYQVNMTNFEPRWHLPWFWSDTYFEKDDFKIHLVALDTELLTFNWFNSSEDLNRDVQMAWFNETMNNADPVDWTIVYGHHPLRSCGRYGPRGNILTTLLDDIFAEHDVDVYIDGHDHNLQHIVQNDTIGVDYVISGGGGRGRYEYQPIWCERLHEDGFTLNFFAERYGFAAFEITKQEIAVTYYGEQLIDGQLEELYSFTRTQDQKRNNQ